MRRLKTFQRWLGFLIVGGGGLVMVLPFVWLITSSFKAANKIYTFPPQFIPDPFRWQNYIEVFTAVPVLRYAQNTIIITVFATIGTVLCTILAGYAFARLRFKGRDFVFSMLLATLMLPYVVTMIPIYVMFSKVGWVNTLLPLIVPSFFGDAFFIFLLRQFFRTIPMELEDAARIDGASRLKNFIPNYGSAGAAGGDRGDDPIRAGQLERLHAAVDLPDQAQRLDAGPGIELTSAL